MNEDKTRPMLTIAAIGTVALTKHDAPMNQVTVKVEATNITTPFGAPSVCTIGSVEAKLFRKVGSGWVLEPPPQPQSMSGSISTGYSTTFGPRPGGDFKGEVTVNWQIMHPETKDAESD